MGRRRGQLEWRLVQPKLIISCAVDSVASLVLKCHHKATCSFKGECKKKRSAVQCEHFKLFFCNKKKKRLHWPKKVETFDCCRMTYVCGNRWRKEGFFQRFEHDRSTQVDVTQWVPFMFLNRFLTIRHGCVPSGLKSASSTTASVLKAAHDNKCWLITILHDWN